MEQDATEEPKIHTSNSAVEKLSEVDAASDTRSTSLAGTRGEEVFNRLLADIEVMYEFARREGKRVPAELRTEISELLARTGVTEDRSRGWFK